MEVRDLLEIRGGTYGQYKTVSKISQDIKRIMRESPNYKIMPDFARESLDMIASKIARILNGNYYYDDSWRDISGYAILAVMEIEELEKHETDNAP